MNVSAGVQVDHINRDTLDNRRKNLRIASRLQSNANRGSHQGGTSKFKGVSWYKRSQRWAAQIQVDGKKIHLGRFGNECVAAIAYNKAALKYHCKFAVLNEVAV
jgi:hypothetical protein